MKCENKSKKKGKRVLPIFGERNLAKKMIKNDKNLRWSQVRIGEREKSSEKLLKKWFWKSQNQFLKNLIHDIRLIEKQFRSIEIDRGSPKILKEILIDRKTVWINRKSGKNIFLEKITWFLKTLLKVLNIRNKIAWVRDEMLFQNTSFNPSFPKIKIFNHSLFKISNTKYVLHKQYLKYFQNRLVRPKDTHNNMYNV